MPSPKVPQAVLDDLRDRNLTIWTCLHPLDFNYIVGGQRGRGRADISRVEIQLAGPGLDGRLLWGYGATVTEATQSALKSRFYLVQRPGVEGALARLEEALWGLQTDMLRVRYNMPGYADEDIPF